MRDDADSDETIFRGQSSTRHVVVEDIRELLTGWGLNESPVRVIEGDDGKPKLQRRLALGVLQLEFEGRPDGQRPAGENSFFDHFRTRCECEGESFFLSGNDCQHLANEAMLYFQRRLCFFDLGDYERAARDAERNLEVFSFVRRYALEDEDSWMLDQYRGFVLSHRARARALVALQAQDRQSALAAVDQGMSAIQVFLDEYGIDEEMAAGDELRQLHRLRDHILGRPIEQPTSADARRLLDEQLQTAIKQEQYERAAELRDRIRHLEERSCD
jgi:tetratricopeptide (TPR) repeat protein